jgi:hypothetical protein
VQPFVEARVPLQGDLDLAVSLRFVERRHPLEEGLLGAVEVLDELDDALHVLEGLLQDGVFPLVAQTDLEAAGQEGHLPEPLEEGLGPELGLLEDLGVGPEGDDGALLAGAPGALQRAVGTTAVEVGLHEAAPVPVDLQIETLGQGVHHRDTHAVQAAGDLVPLAPELAAGMEGGEHHLGGRDARILGVLVDGDAPAVVGHAAPAVLEQGDLDEVGMAGHGLVDGVVDHLVDQVVEARRAGGSDVHPGAFPDRFEALEDRDVLGVVRHARKPSSARGRDGPEGSESAGQGPEIHFCHLTRRVGQERLFQPTEKSTEVAIPRRSVTTTNRVPAGRAPASSAAGPARLPSGSHVSE